MIMKGFRKSVGGAEESTYGVKATTGWKFWDVDTENFPKEKPLIVPTGLRGGIAGPVRAIMGAVNVSGTLAGNLYNEGLVPVLLKVGLGSVSTQQQGGTIAYKHTFTIVDNIIYGEQKGLTIKADRDLRVMDFYGMVVNTIAINSSHGDTPAKINFGLVGKDEDTGTAGTPTYSTVNPFMHFDATFTLDGNSSQIQAFTLSLNNNYKTDYYGAGSSRIKIPRGGMREITGTITFGVIEDFNIFDKFIAGTPASLTIDFKGAEIVSPYNHELKITIPKLYYTGPTDPGSGGVETPTLECPFRVLPTDSANLEFTIEIISTESSI